MTDQHLPGDIYPELVAANAELSRACERHAQRVTELEQVIKNLTHSNNVLMRQLVDIELQASKAPAHTGQFELRQDEDTGRRYWWGAEDGWKDPTEIGENGTLTLSAEHFAIGTRLLFQEPIQEPSNDD